MIAVALKGLAGRKIRALLTALAVVIGISMVSGTYILTDTMQKSFDGLFTATYDKTDAVISGKEIVKNSTTGGTTTIPAAPAEEGAGAARGRGGRRDGLAATRPTRPTSSARTASPSPARAWAAATTPITASSARSSSSRASGPTGRSRSSSTPAPSPSSTTSSGDTITISTLGKKHAFELTGIVTYGKVNSLGFASIAAWDVETAQKLLHREGRFDSISIAAKDGTSSAKLVSAVQPLISSSLQVKDSVKQAKDDADELNSSMAVLKYVLLGFGGIALLVGAFVIFNTLSITVAQRTREFATLRTLGGSRKQVMRSVIAEGFVIGLLASVLGLLAGIGLAKGMVALFAALGVELPDGATIVEPRTVVLSIVVGTVVTLVASILPARRATRVPPIAAVREGSIAAAVAVGRALAQGGARHRRGLVRRGAGRPVRRPQRRIASVVLLGGGVLGLFLGMALLAPRLVGPLARLVGWPARRVGGVAGELAGANAVRNPGRTASTAAALMIGLTLVTVVAVLASSFTRGTQDAVEKDVHAAYVIDGKDNIPFRAAEGDRLERIAGVKSASHVRSDTVIAGGKERVVTGIDPATIAHFFTFRWTKGSEHALAALGTDGAIVTKEYATSQHLALGSSLAVTTPSGAKAKLVVRGIHKPQDAAAGRRQHEPEGVRRGHRASRRTGSRSSTRSRAPARPSSRR